MIWVKQFLPPALNGCPKCKNCPIWSHWLGAVPWNSLVEGGEGSYLLNCQTNLVIAIYSLSLLFCKFINTTAYHFGRYKAFISRAPRQYICLIGCKISPQGGCLSCFSNQCCLKFDSLLRKLFWDLLH